VSVSLCASDGGPAEYDTVEACFAILCRGAERMAGRAAGPSSVALRRAIPADDSAYRAVFGTVLFAQPEDRCVFAPAALRARTIDADPVVRSILSPYAQRRVAHRHVPWTARVADLLGEGSPSLAQAARALAVSTRTLQSRLEREGTSFAALADAARRERALMLMSQPDLPITAVAARLGFATPSAFTKAFRRWTGVAPSRYRRDG
jgi:AraC-like DNA-binding protein